MIVDWTPSLQLVAKARKIAELRKKGLNWYQIKDEVGHSRRYTLAIYEWYLKQKGGDSNVSL